MHCRVLCHTLSVFAFLTIVPVALGRAPELDKRILVCFRNDDVSALSDVDHELRIMGVFERHGLRQTVGVVPMMCVNSVRDTAHPMYLTLGENARIVAVLRRWAMQGKVEIALHGLTHHSNSVITNSRRRDFAEFKGLSFPDQCRRIRAGLAVIETHLGLSAKTFIPPWNEWDENTLRACAVNGIEVFSADLFAPALGGMVPVNQNADLTTFSDALTAAKRSSKRVLIVVVYHSASLHSEDELMLLERTVSAAASDPEVGVVTLAEIASQFPEMAASANHAGLNMITGPRTNVPARMAAHVYRKIASSCGMKLQIDRISDQVREAYRAGDYQEAAGLTSQIDGACELLVLIARAGAVVCSATVGALLAVVLSRVRRVGQRTARMIVGCVVVIPVILGLCGAWGASAKSTREEALLAGGLGAAAILVGWGTCRMMVATAGRLQRSKAPSIA